MGLHSVLTSETEDTVIETSRGGCLVFAVGGVKASCYSHHMSALLAGE